MSEKKKCCGQDRKSTNPRAELVPDLLARLGYSPDDISKMTTEERLRIVKGVEKGITLDK